jgi:hypothetical protein
LHLPLPRSTAPKAYTSLTRQEMQTAENAQNEKKRQKVANLVESSAHG